ncbi:hypothetical protein AH6C_02 [Aeromonas phage pAh6-C]|uniref:DUF4054 domain-containing protein n=1 Tax=Aeromonas phage pAh6-C TaxID=1505227 RepID=A0A076G3L9_9CAUD|nr:virion structural protein [Aeromonas phage pAh6-C]AII26756.1 hypothetical protein AH6C_02 [Aeromonas phage pAh6-C]
MLTYDSWLDKFPQFVAVSEPQWVELQLEATVEMGADVFRWNGQDAYDIAQGYLMAHLAAQAESSETGDHTPLQPFREKEVDDVRVEYAVSRDMQNNLDPYLATSYGQQYIKWRRMAFAGPRVI